MDYGRLYDENYYKTGFGKDSYLESDKWKPFYEKIADRIVELLHPSTVLDVGCAIGYIVAALRDRGVEAYGIDASEFAISQVREDIKPYCRASSATEPLPADLPQKYDLLITIEVAEHLYEEDGKKLIANICSYSDKIVFSSTPDDITETTHVNVQMAEYWARIFAGHSFFKDSFMAMDFISPWAVLYSKRTDIQNIIHEYEMKSRLDKAQSEQQRQMQNTFCCNLFYDTGDGFNVRDMLTSQNLKEGEEIFVTFQLPPEVKAIRFDPIEYRCCIVKNLQIVTDNEAIVPVNVNGVKVDEFDIFDNIDPQFLVNFNGKPTRWVKIKASVYSFEEMDLQALLAKFRKLYAEMQKSMQNKDKEIQILRDEINRIQAEIRQLILDKNEEIRKVQEDARKANDESERKLAEAQRIISGKDIEIQGAQEEIGRIKAEAQRVISDKDLEIKSTQEEIGRIQAEAQRIISDKDLEIKNAQAEMQELISQKDDEIEAGKNDISEVQNEMKELLTKIDEVTCTSEVKDVGILNLTRELEANKALYSQALGQCSDLTNRLGIIEAMYNSISNSTFWKLTKPFRILLDIIKKPFRLLYKVLVTVKQKGIRFTLKKIKVKIFGQKELNITTYEFMQGLDAEEEARQRQFTFSSPVKISLIVPTYQTKREYLEELIDSVKNQTYQSWELCIADGGSNTDTVKDIKTLCKNDPRIKVKFLDCNKGIAGNTVEAYSLSTGDYIVLLDHDDFLSRDALFEIAKCVNETPDADFIYSDRAVFSHETRKILAYHYFPSFSPEYLKSCNDTSHLTAFSRRILDEVGFEREGYDGSQDYELELRVSEKARRVANIQKVLYFCRACEGSVALNPESKFYAYEAGRKAIGEHIARIGYPGAVEFLNDTFSYRIRYDILNKYKVSIIIPNKDNIDILQKCIGSILQKTHYVNYEILIVENNSVLPETFKYYESLKGIDNISVLHYPVKEFNYSAINNWAAVKADGDILLLLNNDVEVISEDWLTEMLMYAQMDEVGAVGAILLYPDNTFQHTGLFIGLGGHIASAFDHGKNAAETGYMRRLIMPQNYSAVTAACLMVKREDYLKVGGLDAEDFKIGLNDVDFCLKLREMGKRNVVTPYAKLYHHESVSRGSDEEGENKCRFANECDKFRKKWAGYYENGDPYLNTNLDWRFM